MYKTHGLYKLPEYRIWQSMRQRCGNPKSTAYQFYGSRGITVCPRWQASFEAFLQDVGRRPAPNLTLERRDNSKGYTPENCYWADRKTQSRNTRSNRRITAFGKTMTMAEWAEYTGISLASLNYRLNRAKLSPEEALTAGKRTPENTRWVEFEGQRLSMSEWARRLGTTTNTISRRLARMPLEKALTTPVRVCARRSV